MNIPELTEKFRNRGPVVLVILDGWGLGKQDESDAVFQANTPHIDNLGRNFPNTSLLTHGLHVGLPSANDIGGSEVGHMTIGAGRIISQGPTVIKNQMDSGAFFQGESLGRLIGNCLRKDTPLHLLGLFSDGNVHSHINHFYRIMEHALGKGVRRVYLHALLDGRDVGYQSALEYVEPMEAWCQEINRDHPGFDYGFASGGGREVLTMDRDNNWEKVRLGWWTHVRGHCQNTFLSASEAIRAFRKATPEAVDQDLPPFVLSREGQPIAPMGDGHSVIFMNFRGDRAIQFTKALLQPDFNHFDRGLLPEIEFAGMSVYDEDTNMPPQRLAMPPTVENPLGKRILEMGYHQFRVTETQKFAHITFFFNGGYREPLDEEKETYDLVPSDQVNSFADKPAMQAAEIARRAAWYLREGRCRFGLINFANADMVGHCGNLKATIQGVQAVDTALGELLQAVKAVNGIALITADHGNADEMVVINANTGKREPSTRHSINPVPVYLYDPQWQANGDYSLRANDPENPNTLANIAATVLVLLGQPVPADIEPPLFVVD